MTINNKYLISYIPVVVEGEEEAAVTPVKVNHFVDLLEQANYNPQETEFIRQGFSQGFDIGYAGPEIRSSKADNIPLRIGTKTQLWNKLMKEVKLKRVVGPFSSIPYEHYIQSPIGLVPKAGNKTRLIFHLSYDFSHKLSNGDDDKSLNFHTPKHLCSVKYNDIDHAVTAILKLVFGNERTAVEFARNSMPSRKPPKMVFSGKTDISSVFRLVPLLCKCWKWLIMKTQHPESGEWKYFVDKCLPLGASISCAIFQRVSDALKYLIEFHTSAWNRITNYLDDFLFIALTLIRCNFLIQEFLNLCEEIGVPIALEKTEWATLQIVFLGILLDGEHLSLGIPLEKCNRALYLLNSMLSRRKATVKELQTLCGYLNFLNKAIFPGRTFTRRMYAKYSTMMPPPSPVTKKNCDAVLQQFQSSFKLKQYHHVNLDGEFKKDCEIWVKFLDANIGSVVNRPMVDVLGPERNFNDIRFYTDTSGARHLGFGCVMETSWFNGSWEPGFIDDCKPSIEYLELYALCVGILTWEHRLTNTRITVFCDNIAVVHMVNNLSAKCVNCMYLLRILVLNCLQFNRRVNVKYISTRNNFLADALSRGQMSQFRKLGLQMNINPDDINEKIYPVSKIWQTGKQ